MWTLLVSLLAVGAPPPTLGEFVTRFKGSVVHLSIDDGRGHEVGNGSGFFVTASGRVVTNHHVIEHASRMTALLADGRKMRVLGVLADDEEHDLAVLQVEGSGYAPLELGDGASLKVGDQVVVISSPEGLAGTLSEGMISALRAEGATRAGVQQGGVHTEHWQIQHNADTAPGSSGSPLMTRDGQVVGVVVGGVGSGKGLNFAIPVQEARALVDGIPAGATPRPIGSSVRRNLIISTAGFGVLALLWIVFTRAGRAGRKVHLA